MANTKVALLRYCRLDVGWRRLTVTPVRKGRGWGEQIKVPAGKKVLEVGDYQLRWYEGGVLFHDTIHRDSKTGRIPRQVLRNGKLVNDRTWKQQVVGGMWVHWVQKGMDPEAWGELFVGDKRCMLKRSVATLLIDDKRNLPADRVARTFQEGIDALTEQHWNLLYLDHDLGDFSGTGGREMTGYDIACWLEQNPQHLPDRIEVVSNNPAGRRNIELALQRCFR